MNDIVSGALLFTGERSAQGFRINKMAASLTEPANRDRFKADEDAFMRSFGMTDAERQLVHDRDWKGMMDAGASIHVIIKIGGSTGHPLPVIGNHTAGRV